MEPLPTLFDLLRHGEPQGGTKYRGHLDDPLSATGWAQMRAAVQADEPWQRIVSSPLQRCQAFARELADARGLPLEIEPAFMEISFGDWEGLTLEQVQARDPERLQAFWRGEADPPGGEPLADFVARLRGAWQHWRERCQGEHVLLVCHGGVIRVLLADVLGLEVGHALARIQVDFACRSRVRLDGPLSSLLAHGYRSTPP
ncbi:histidine phosphatase family protein [Isoalcanivorax beigongshangi]|uniref:Histidine phosphatase family protein n=1 Tax=Isoalcanivorax beigongshangi TaxID=3238810 RepID=A0ABV4AEI2_9GAMM